MDTRWRVRQQRHLHLGDPVAGPAVGLWGASETAQRAAGWLPVVEAIENGELTWFDLPTVTRLLMPTTLVVRCVVRHDCPGRWPPPWRTTPASASWPAGNSGYTRAAIADIAGTPGQFAGTQLES